MRAFRIKLSDEAAAAAQAAAERLGTPVEEFLARAVAEKVREAAPTRPSTATRRPVRRGQDR